MTSSTGQEKGADVLTATKRKVLDVSNLQTANELGSDLNAGTMH